MYSYHKKKNKSKKNKFEVEENNGKLPLSSTVHYLPPIKKILVSLGHSYLLSCLMLSHEY